MGQSDLFGSVWRMNYTGVTGRTIQERFDSFHRLNPQVYDALRNMAVRMRRTGRKRYGMKGLFEVLRWNYSLQTTGDDFKLNNDFTALYARKLMDENPQLAGFFAIRTRPSGR